jgi:hypothetical protein
MKSSRYASVEARKRYIAERRMETDITRLEAEVCRLPRRSFRFSQLNSFILCRWDTGSQAGCHITTVLGFPHPSIYSFHRAKPRAYLRQDPQHPHRAQCQRRYFDPTAVRGNWTLFTHRPIRLVRSSRYWKRAFRRAPSRHHQIRCMATAQIPKAACVSRQHTPEFRIFGEFAADASLRNQIIAAIFYQQASQERD